MGSKRPGPNPLTRIVTLFGKRLMGIDPFSPNAAVVFKSGADDVVHFTFAVLSVQFQITHHGFEDPELFFALGGKLLLSAFFEE